MLYVITDHSAPIKRTLATFRTYLQAVEFIATNYNMDYFTDGIITIDEHETPRTIDKE